MTLTPDRYLIDTGQYRPPCEMRTCGNITVTCPICFPTGEAGHDFVPPIRPSAIRRAAARRASRPRTRAGVALVVGDTPRVHLTALVRRLGRTHWFARLGRLVSGVDRRLQKASRGRWSVLGPPRLPQLILRTTGRVSGEPREAVLLYALDGDAWVL